MKELMKNPPNYRHIEDRSCFSCTSLREKEKLILPPFKSYYCDLFKNNLSEVEAYYYTCEAYFPAKKLEDID
jgi:hypothetical protein